MAGYRYERLSALDNFFLVCESPTTPMHVGSTALFEAGSLSTPEGAIDSGRIRHYIASRLDRIPRYRQRLVRIPLEQRTVWVDDPHVDLDYHVQHTSLPKPGDDTQLKQLSARIQTHPLDLTKPLWETWIVEGLQGGRFALIFKVHHCMIDGVSGADLLSVLLSPTAETGIEAPKRWRPHAAPSGAELLRDEILQRLEGPVSFASRAARHPLAVAAEIGDAVGAVAETLGSTLQSASPTPLNQPIGVHRRFDWAAMDLGTIKRVKDALGGTINDVVLTTVAGGVRTYLRRRGMQVGHLDFRAFVPVSTRSAEQRGAMGNRVAGWIVNLPIGEPDALTRFRHVRDATRRLKQSNHARGAEVLTGIAEWTSPSLMGMVMRRASQSALAFNLVVTNVPGPPVPLYLLGSRLQAVYPMVPLFVNLGLGIALFSNAGTLFWGVNADWDVVPDLTAFVGGLQAAFRELCALVPDQLPLTEIETRTPSRRAHERAFPPARRPATGIGPATSVIPMVGNDGQGRSTVGTGSAGRGAPEL
ncbi:MAG: wax ester/triacylglycerol synthase family O-acyltransferase [Candidatus Binatia bacterium]